MDISIDNKMSHVEFLFSEKYWKKYVEHPKVNLTAKQIKDTKSNIKNGKSKQRLQDVMLIGRLCEQIEELTRKAEQPQELKNPHNATTEELLAENKYLSDRVKRLKQRDQKFQKMIKVLLEEWRVKIKPLKIY